MNYDDRPKKGDHISSIKVPRDSKYKHFSSDEYDEDDDLTYERQRPQDYRFGGFPVRHSPPSIPRVGDKPLLHPVFGMNHDEYWHKKGDHISSIKVHRNSMYKSFSSDEYDDEDEERQTSKDYRYGGPISTHPKQDHEKPIGHSYNRLSYIVSVPVHSLYTYNEKPKGSADIPHSHNSVDGKNDQYHETSYNEKPKGSNNYPLSPTGPYHETSTNRPMVYINPPPPIRTTVKGGGTRIEYETLDSTEACRR